MAPRFQAVLDVNDSLELLGVVLVSTATTARVVQKEACDHSAALFGQPDVVFEATVRHPEATAQETGEHGQLVHELDEENQRAPKWYEQLRNRASQPRVGPRSAGSVADGSQAVTQEIVARITVAEQEVQQS